MANVAISIRLKGRLTNEHSPNGRFRGDDSVLVVSSEDDYARYGEASPGYHHHGTSCKQRFYAFLGRIFTPEYRAEFLELVNLSFPTILTSMSHFLMLTISLIMCGHLNKYQLDAAALANSLISVFGIITNLGFSTACDTLFSQTYGTSQKKKMGLYLQRAFVVALPILFVMTALHINLEKILLLMGQNRLISSMAAEYALYFIPGLYCDCIFIVLARYMQNQGILYPPMAAAMIGIGVNALLQYVAIYILGMGYQASAICQAIAFACAAMFELVYTVVSGYYKDTWDGWKWGRMWHDVGSFYVLAVAGILMVSFEEWSFEIGTIVCGTLGTVQLAVQSIVFQLEALTYMIPIGISIAVNIRVGNQLGAGNPQGARRTYLVALTMIAITATVTAGLCVSMSRQLANIFTSDPEVLEAASHVIMLLGAFQYMDGIAVVSGGALRGCGRQLLGSIMVFIGFYVLALPIGITLALTTELQVFGMWLGLIIGIGVEAGGFVLLVLCLDWKKESDKAIERVSEDTNLLDDDALNQETPQDYASYTSGPKLVSTNRNSSRSNYSSVTDHWIFNSERHTGGSSHHRRQYSSISAFSGSRFCSIAANHHKNRGQKVVDHLSRFPDSKSESNDPAMSTGVSAASEASALSQKAMIKLIISRVLLYLTTLLLIAGSLIYRFNSPRIWFDLCIPHNQWENYTRTHNVTMLPLCEM